MNARRRRGRPQKPQAERLAQGVRCRVPDDVFDAMCHRARAVGKSVASIASEALTVIFRGKSLRSETDVS